MVAILDRSLGEVCEPRSIAAEAHGELTAMRRMVPRVRAPVRFLMYLRFARYLLWEFRWPLVIFTTLVLGGGLDPPPVLRPRPAAALPVPATPSS